MTTETELKLSLTPRKNAAFRRLLATRVPPAGAAVTEHLLSIYYDTPALDLARRDMALRLRKVGDQWIQTLKAGEQAGAGLHQRIELEDVVDGQALDLDRLRHHNARHGGAGSAVGFVLREDIAASLAPLFTTDFQRARWLLDDGHGNRVEVALDDGAIIGTLRREFLHEVEIELKQGSVQALFDLALDWTARLPLIPDARSKAERGHALCVAEAPLTPSRARIPRLHASMGAHDVRKTLLLECMRHLQANVPGVLASRDAEFVHQARVALRRMQSALKTFGDLTAGAAGQADRAEIRWLAGLLGDLRDLDVLLAQTLPAIEAGLAPDADLAPLRKVLLERRDKARRAARAALTSARYGTLLLRLLSGMNQPAPPDEVSLHEFVHHALNRCWRRVDGLARDWRVLDREQRHELRKCAKRLRYAAEFVAPLYKSRPVRRYLDRLETLQEILGTLNDGVVAQRLIADVIGLTPRPEPEPACGADTALAFAGGLAAGWMARAAQGSDADAERACAGVGQAARFW